MGSTIPVGILTNDTWGLIVRELDLPDVHALMLTCVQLSRFRAITARAAELVNMMHTVKENPLCLAETRPDLLTVTVVLAALRRYPDAVMGLFETETTLSLRDGVKMPILSRVVCKCSVEVIIAVVTVLTANMYLVSKIDRFVRYVRLAFPDFKFSEEFYLAGVDWGKIDRHNIPIPDLTEKIIVRGYKGVYSDINRRCGFIVPKKLWSAQLLYLRLQHDSLDGLHLTEIVEFITADSELAFKLASVLCRVLENYSRTIIKKLSYMTPGWFTGLAKCHGCVVFMIIPEQYLNVDIYATLIENGHPVESFLNTDKDELRSILISRGKMEPDHLQQILQQLAFYSRPFEAFFVKPPFDSYLPVHTPGINFPSMKNRSSCNHAITDAEVMIKWARDRISRKNRLFPVSVVRNISAREIVRDLPYINDGIPHGMNCPISYAKGTLMRTFEMLEKLLALKSESAKIIAAGGAVAKAIWNQLHKCECDVDLFFIGTDTTASTELLHRAINLLIKLAPKKTHVQRNGKTVTVQIYDEDDNLRPYTFTYQFVLRLYPSIGHLLGGFDIPAAAIAFDGTDFIATEFGEWCCINRLIVVDTERRSLSYEYRLTKYSRYCTLLFPGLQKVRMRDYASQIMRNWMDDRQSYLRQNGAAHDSIHGLIPLKAYEDQRILHAYAAENGIKILRLEVACETKLQQNEVYRLYEECHKIDKKYGLYNGEALRIRLGLCYIFHECKYNVRNPLMGDSYFIKPLNRTTDYGEFVTVPLLLKHNLGFIRTGRLANVTTSVCNPKCAADCFGVPVFDPLFDSDEIRARYNGLVKSRPNRSDWAPRHLRKLFPWHPDLINAPHSEFSSMLAGAATATVGQILKIADEVSAAYRKIEWITENPGRQWTSSFNPIIADPRDWYGELYSPLVDVSPAYRALVDTEYTLRLMRRRYPFNTLPRDIFNIIALIALGLS